MSVNLLQNELKCPSLEKNMRKRSESRASHWNFAANQMTVNFSRQVSTNHVWLKRVLERHVTSNPFSPFFFFPCAAVRVVWEMCFGQKRTANVVENILFWISKNWQKAQRCRSVSLLSQTLRFVI